MTDRTALEQKLLAREKSYRRGRAGCLAIAAITLVACIIVLLGNPSDEVFLASGSVQVMFWLALAYAAHARVQHVETIKQKSM